LQIDSWNYFPSGTSLILQNGKIVALPVRDRRRIRRQDFVIDLQERASSRAFSTSLSLAILERGVRERQIARISAIAWSGRDECA